MAEKNVFEIDGGDDSDSENSNSDSESENENNNNNNNKIEGRGRGDSDDEFDEEEEDDGDNEENIFESTDLESDVRLNRNIEFDEDEDDDDEEEDEEENHDENYLQKFNEQLKTNVIAEHHPELIVQNFHEVDALCNIVRDSDGIIIDPLHRTLPFITKYEKAKILGERAKQLNAGAEAFVDLGDEIVDGYLIAMAEFEQKKIPMIIRRPLPNNGSEYWRLVDLEIL